MKSILFLILVFSGFAGNTQSVFSNTTNTAIQKVIEDYPNRFSNIKGDKIGGNQHAMDYHSKVIVPGAANSIITSYPNSKPESFSWKSELFGSSDFNESKERFKELFNNIKNTIVKIDGLPPYILNGIYELPQEDRKATTIVFQLLPASGDLQKVTVDLTLKNTANKWKICLSVYEKETSNNVIASSN